jgi:maltose alpha-D-glucosyltransferase/alpha-amylase
MKKSEKIIRECWQELYSNRHDKLLATLITELQQYNRKFPAKPSVRDWYKDAVVYSLYVDLFNVDFPGLVEKLDYLQNLGINCIWLLPILDSPMKDGGFDIRRYDRVRRELLGLDEHASDETVQAVFRNFLQEAKERNIRVIFDIAMNHVSDEHQWFKSAKSSVDNPFRNYFIWNDNDKKYNEARLLFKGMVNSNWEKHEEQFFFHRFYPFQPDLNYRNPNVPLAMCRNFLYWLEQGVDGFRADAIPFLWKEDDTNCENLAKTHTIVRLFRAVLNYVKPETLLLAEACQPPHEVVKYFGNEDECHAGYHFPLMPQIFKALAQQDRNPVIEILKAENTPEIPVSCQWFLFLRNHDELTLEMVSPEDRKIIHDYYCRDPKWDFRVGEGVSSRLANLLEENPQRIGLAFSLMFTLPGTPIIYYGDEFGRVNDKDFFEQMKKMTGYGDSRFFVRGKVNWLETESELSNPETYSARVYKIVNTQILARNKSKAFGRGKLQWVDIKNNKGENEDGILAYLRIFNNEKILIVNNLSDKEIKISLPDNNFNLTDLLGRKPLIDNEKFMTIIPYGFHWFSVKS